MTDLTDAELSHLAVEFETWLPSRPKLLAMRLLVELHDHRIAQLTDSDVPALRALVRWFAAGCEKRKWHNAEDGINVVRRLLTEHGSAGKDNAP
jgi:hypothetical protein